DRIQIFTDGSGYQGGIGAAAVLLREGQEPRALRYHLGNNEEHTVYEAELLGLTLAAHLIATERNLIYPLSILVDNQAAIHTGEVMNKTGSSYVADQFERMTKRLAQRRETRDNFKLTVRWIPGHMKVVGNEIADKEAKDAAKGNERNSPAHLLPKYLR
ncbi:ribonuclease H-like protein, partial [Suillus hirtellus]